MNKKYIALPAFLAFATATLASGFALAHHLMGGRYRQALRTVCYQASAIRSLALITSHRLSPSAASQRCMGPRQLLS